MKWVFRVAIKTVINATDFYLGHILKRTYRKHQDELELFKNEEGLFILIE